MARTKTSINAPTLLATEWGAGNFGANYFGSGVFGQRTFLDVYVTATVTYEATPKPKSIKVIRNTVNVLYGDNIKYAIVKDTYSEVAAAFNIASEWVLVETKYPPREADLLATFSSDIRVQIVNVIYASASMTFDISSAAVVLLPSYADAEINYTISVHTRYLWEPIPDLADELWSDAAFAADPFWKLVSPGQGNWS